MGIGTDFKRWRRDFYRRHIKRDPFSRAIKRWHEDNGERLRSEYPLGPDSVVIDVGGYVGDFASEIYEKYRAKVFLYEPVSSFYEACVSRFASNADVSCFHYGMSNENTTMDIVLSDDASSTNIASENDSVEKIELRRATECLADMERIDLFKINIEGGEYQVLPDLINSGAIAKIDFLQIQFHDFIDGAVSMRNEIVKDLEATHERQWCYDFVWESWKRKS